MRKVPRRGWQQLSAGPGVKGPRLHDWAAIDLTPTHTAGICQLLIRRNRTTGELAYYRCFSPLPVPLSVLARVAGTRRRIEETFQADPRELMSAIHRRHPCNVCRSRMSSKTYGPENKRCPPPHDIHRDQSS